MKHLWKMAGALVVGGALLTGCVAPTAVAPADTAAPAAEGKTAAPPKPPEPLSADERAQVLAELQAKEAELRRVQGESPLVHVCVNSQAIAETVASWTGIPVGRMVADEIKTVLNLKDLMEEVIVGQSHALNLISQLAHVEILSPKPAESLRFFTDIMGLEISGRRGQSVFLRGWGEFFSYSLQLTEGPQPGLGHIAWRSF